MKSEFRIQLVSYFYCLCFKKRIKAFELHIILLPTSYDAYCIAMWTDKCSKPTALSKFARDQAPVKEVTNTVQNTHR